MDQPDKPAGLSWRWLPARDEDEEVTEPSAMTPVCGWVLTDNLEDRLMIYDGGGVPQGSVDEVGRWRLPPGRTGPASPADIENRHLRRMVHWVCAAAAPADEDAGKPTCFVGNYVRLLDRALDRIDPTDPHQAESSAVLMGRPLALVRVAMSLEPNGLARETDSDERQRGASGPIQVRLQGGEHRQLNDGVIGWWVEDGDEYADGQFRAAQSDRPRDDVLDRCVSWEPSITLTPEDGERVFSLLLDPRGDLQVLLTATMSLPSNQFRAALRAIQVSFLITPVLTDTGSVVLPPPTERAWEWSWVQRNDAGWSTAPAAPVLAREAVMRSFPANGERIWQELLEAGWLQAIDGDGLHARVIPKDSRPPGSLSGELTALESDIQRLLDPYGRTIGPVREGRYGGHELREGWLKLNPPTKGTPPRDDDETEPTT